MARARATKPGTIGAKTFGIRLTKSTGTSIVGGVVQKSENIFGCREKTKSVLSAILTKKMKQNKKFVWVVMGHSESQDEYGPKVYEHKPTKEELKEFIVKDTDESINNDGPGNFGSYVYLKTKKVVLNP